MSDKDKCQEGEWAAKDVSEDAILSAIQSKSPSWATTLDMELAFSGIPHKVLMAKLRSMIKRGVITGCACGCRGEFELND